ncbi:Gfo/Idh/MocA family protein [Rubellimicrobium sp. CFH 75288]|uniref:Gfo/Idh/MocA family protein n=1 Tax=Rubellimicrobium sp. CFH 75288 TaxID=2697034 RepID=UPI001412A536|nr:Gfo/Idh/MocA family oxidoreductase [Rubellimicrobium sp. CFH 75288]NAZ35651.1 Gfo/Idh/MocA family oxidoreductase [Rubellimicrobium sp. CFH 75288]
MTGAALIGTGFIGAVHLDALRRLGIPVRGLLGSSPARGAERAAAWGLPRAYATLEDLLADPAVEVVHVTSPNRLHHPQVSAILRAGRHVVCEKPLAMDSAQSAELVDLAGRSGRIAALCHNIRFYPLNRHARGLVAGGEIGPVRLMTGAYHQDWLSREEDWNWRLDPSEGGGLRALGDIGTHWIDLVCHLSGLWPEAIFADLATLLPERLRPAGPVETFARDRGGGERVRVRTEDVGLVLLRFPGGARGSLSVSQVSPGRKNAIRWEIAGAEATLAWEGEDPDRLWIGRREGPSSLLLRDPSLLNAEGRAATSLPGGHAEGFADSFRALFAAIYADIAAGRRSPAAAWADFADGHRMMRLLDAAADSARTGRWIDLAAGEPGRPPAQPRTERRTP